MIAWLPLVVVYDWHPQHILSAALIGAVVGILAVVIQCRLAGKT